MDLGPPTVPYLRQWFKSLRVSAPPPPEDFNLSGQTGVVTGANGGLGFETAAYLLQFNISRLIITVRDKRKGAETVARLQSLYPKARIDVWLLDMLSYDSIQEFSQKCAGIERLDFAILNAGTQGGSFVLNKSTGHEAVFQLNYLSTVLLTLLLLPVMKSKKAGRPGRITMVGSGLALMAKFPEQKADPIIPAFDNSAGWGMQAAAERYSTTKLLLLMFIAKLKDHVSPNDVVVNVADPGFMRNGGMDEALPAVLRIPLNIMRSTLGRDPKGGAWAFIDAAILKPETSHGSWTYNWEVWSYVPLDYQVDASRDDKLTARSFPHMMHLPEGKKVADRLWGETIAELGFADTSGILSSMAG